jgi:hypothetical protein
VVDPAWLERVRHENRKKLGLPTSPGMSGMGAAADIAAAFSAQQSARPQTVGGVPILKAPEPSKAPEFLFKAAVGLLGLGLLVYTVKAVVGR